MGSKESAVRSIGLIGKKVGMTRVFTDEGKSIPVTVLDVSSNRISQIRTQEIDGYQAVQMAFGERRASRLTKAVKGHLAKAGVSSAQRLMEFRLSSVEGRAAGDTLGVNIFQVGQFVDVTGQTLGKGFSGVIKRHNFSSNRATHGNSRSHNTPGSIGMRQDPGRVFPGKRMAGHLGDVRVTLQNLEVIKIDEERNLLWVKGSVPGYEGALLTVKNAVKTKLKSSAHGQGVAKAK